MTIVPASPLTTTSPARSLRAEIKAILKAAPAAIFIAHDPECKRITRSRAAREMLKAIPRSEPSTHGSANGRAPRVRVFRAGQELDLSELPVQQAARGVEVRGVELGLVLPDGLSRHLYGSATPLLDELGRPAGAIGVFVDVTSLKASNDALAAKVRELVRSNAELERFAAVVSHDLRSPLLSLTGCTEVLLDEHLQTLSAEGRELVGYIHESAFHMAQLIKSLLRNAAVETGQLEVTECDINAVIRLVIDQLHSALKTTGGKVTSDALPVIRANEMQMCQLLQNLIENSLKYCRDTPPRIHVSAGREPSFWCFSVKDNGIGISPQDFDSIFHSNHQPRRDTSQYTGLGLGLATCKKIVERHGGRIWLESQAGQGTTFFFSLPKSDGGLIQSVAIPSSSSDLASSEEKA